MPDNVQGMAVLSSRSGGALRRANAFVADACRGLRPDARPETPCPETAGTVHHFALSSIPFCATQPAGLARRHPERYQRVSA